jgi:hypothetical protein
MLQFILPLDHLLLRSATLIRWPRQVYLDTLQDCWLQGQSLSDSIVVHLVIGTRAEADVEIKSGP